MDVFLQECMRQKPQMREINRPNLKQSCQVRPVSKVLFLVLFQFVFAGV